MAKVYGVDKLRLKLRTLPVAVEKALAPVMEEIANTIVTMAKNLVREDSGELKDSIGWVWGDAPSDARIVIGTVRVSKRGNFKITVFAGNDKAFYARWVEFGTAAHINGGKFAGTKNPGTAARPFFYPAWRANRRKAKGKISRVINKAAKRVAAGGSDERQCYN